MPLSRLGDGGVHNGGEGGSFEIVGFTTGLNLPFLDISSLFVGLLVFFYLCGYFTRA